MHESADFCQIDEEHGRLTYVCNLARVPVETGGYDLILLTQTLEHIPEPTTVLDEMHRILKPSGELWLSAPLFCAEHETPFDFYRYTRFGLRHLLESAGFTIKRMEWLEGYYGTLSYQMATAATALPLNPKAYRGGLTGVLAAGVTLLIKPLTVLLSIKFAQLDPRRKHKYFGRCKNHPVVAVKRLSETETRGPAQVISKPASQPLAR